MAKAALSDGANMLRGMTEKWRQKSSVGAEGETSPLKSKRSTRGLHNHPLQHYFSKDDTTSLRAKARQIVSDSRFDSVMGFVIVFNVIVMIFQTNTKAKESKDPTYKGPMWEDIVEYMLLAIYTLELSLRGVGFGHYFFRMRWNCIDLLIVVMSYLDIIITQVVHLSAAGEDGAPPVTILRIFRIFRLLRVVRILRFSYELQTMVRGFLGAMMAMFWGGVMIFILLLVIGILTVELVHPLQVEGLDEWCTTSFRSVQACMLMFFQTLLAGDSWGRCAIPVIKAHPWTALIFATALVAIKLGFTNLILAVIVERAHQHSEQDAAERLNENKKLRDKARARILHAIQSIDKDNGGSITLHELEVGMKSNKELLDTMALVDMDETDFLRMFEFMVDEKGEVAINDFVDNLQKAETQGMQMQVMMLTLALIQIQRRFAKRPGTAAGSAEPPRKKLSEEPQREPKRAQS